MSSFAVSAFMATRTSISFLRAMYPFLLARMVNQVGSPAMFEGNRFLPETGTPIWKMERSRMELALCDPEPLAVATWMLKSLTTGARSADVAEPVGAISVVTINTPDSVAPRNMHDGVGGAVIIGQ